MAVSSGVSVKPVPAHLAPSTPECKLDKNSVSLVLKSSVLDNLINH